LPTAGGRCLGGGWHGLQRELRQDSVCAVRAERHNVRGHERGKQVEYGVSRHVCLGAVSVTEVREARVQLDTCRVATVFRNYLQRRRPLYRQKTFFQSDTVAGYCCLTTLTKFPGTNCSQPHPVNCEVGFVPHLAAPPPPPGVHTHKLLQSGGRSCSLVLLRYGNLFYTQSGWWNSNGERRLTEY
jgi:hypothetical protein